MEPVSIAVAASTIVSLLAKKGLEEIGKGLGTAALAGTQATIEKIKRWVAGRPQLSPALEAVEANPADESHQMVLKKKLEQEMEADAQFANQLRAIVADNARNGRISNQFQGPVKNVINVPDNNGTIHIS